MLKIINLEHFEISFNVGRVISPHCSVFENAYYCVDRAKRVLIIYSLTEVSSVIHAKRHGVKDKGGHGFRTT